MNDAATLSRPDAAPHGDAQPLADLIDKAVQAGATSLHLAPKGGGGGSAQMRVGPVLEPLADFSPGAMRGLHHAIDRAAAASDRLQMGSDGDGAPIDWRVARLAQPAGDRVVLTRGMALDRACPLADAGMRPAMARNLKSALSGTCGVVLVTGTDREDRDHMMRILARMVAHPRRACIAARGDVDGLTAAMAQDPDILLIDLLDTAAGACLAFDAARDRMLVVAGLSADSAVMAIEALRALRIERFHLASTLRAVVVQRRAARLCPACRQPIQASNAISALLGFDPGAVVYSAEGCDRCDGHGTSGKVGVFEAMFCDAALARLLHDGGDVAILARHAFVGAPDMGSAARSLVREGEIAPEEALRLARPPRAVTA